MKKIHFPWPAQACLTAMTLCFSASLAQAQSAPIPAGRLLASNCFQCHGTNGKGPGFDTLAGKPAGELYNELKEFQTTTEDKGIMGSHAKGYTDDQLKAIAQWLSTQQ